jgi:L-lactate dehydrogenase
LEHAVAFTRECRVEVGDLKALTGSDVVAITAGPRMSAGETRLDLLGRSATMFREMLPAIAAAAPEAVLVIATNPVDIMTQAAIQYSGLPSHQVVGSGTLLDTARFRYLLGHYYQVDPHSVEAYIIGEHGDGQVAVFSSARIAGVRLAEHARQLKREHRVSDIEAMIEEARMAAYEIKARKGASYYGVGTALVPIVEAILRDENAVLPVSIRLAGEYGLDNVALSLPAVINRRGIARVIAPELDNRERAALGRSAELLRELAEKAL